MFQKENLKVKQGQEIRGFSNERIFEQIRMMNPRVCLLAHTVTDCCYIGYPMFCGTAPQYKIQNRSTARHNSHAIRPIEGNLILDAGLYQFIIFLNFLILINIIPEQFTVKPHPALFGVGEGRWVSHKKWGTIIPVYSWHTLSKRAQNIIPVYSWHIFFSKRTQHTKNCEGSHSVRSSLLYQENRTTITWTLTKCFSQ